MRVLEEIPSQTPEESGIELNSSEYQPLGIATLRRGGVVVSLLSGRLLPHKVRLRNHICFCVFFLNQAIDEQNIIHLPTTVKNIMDSWTYQGGFPVITLSVSTGVVKQEPFYLEKTENQTLVSHK